MPLPAPSLSAALGRSEVSSAPTPKAPVSPDGGEETEAAEALMAALKSGDPEEVVMAYKELKRACSYEPEESESDEEV